MMIDEIKYLIIIAFCIFLGLIVFTALIYSINLRSESDTDYGEGVVDLDSDLSPSYAYDSAGRLLAFNSILVAGPIILGIISLTFIIPNIILKIKKIPTRKYMLIIAASILIFFAISWIQSGLSALAPERFEQELDHRIILISALIPMGIGAVPLMVGIVLLKKAKLRQRK